MIIKSATFVKSSTNAEQLPAPKYPEYSFIGRSNVGKSSLLNMLTGFKNLAKTSSTPGKTKLINHFLINETWYMADLPGYGFAKVSKTEKKSWDGMIKGYLEKRTNLLTVFLLIDSRHDPLKNDLEFMQWLGEKQIPFFIVFTKADKLNTTKLQAAIASYKKHLKEYWEELPPYVVSSSEKGMGKEEILHYIEETNKIFTPSKL
ncbi:MAG: ribosome biogenesis GTP-binding protein YihA/YsxC [Bacteroidia bacterium]